MLSFPGHRARQLVHFPRPPQERCYEDLPLMGHSGLSCFLLVGQTKSLFDCSALA